MECGLKSLIRAGLGVVLLGGEVGGDELPLRFRQHILNAKSEYSAAAVLDVDRDGQSEILSGAFLYRAPNWQPEKIREIELIRGRYDDYANCPPTSTRMAGLM